MRPIALYRNFIANGGCTFAHIIDAAAAHSVYVPIRFDFRSVLFLFRNSISSTQFLCLRLILMPLSRYMMWLTHLTTILWPVRRTKFARTRRTMWIVLLYGREKSHTKEVQNEHLTRIRYSYWVMKLQCKYSATSPSPSCCLAQSVSFYHSYGRFSRLCTNWTPFNAISSNCVHSTYNEAT